MKSKQFSEDLIKEALFTKHIEVPRYGESQCIDFGWGHYLNIAKMPFNILEKMLQCNLTPEKSTALFQSCNPEFISSILDRIDTLTDLEIESLVFDSGVKPFYIAERHESAN